MGSGEWKLHREANGRDHASSGEKKRGGRLAEGLKQWESSTSIKGSVWESNM